MFYVYDLYNNEIVSPYYNTEDEAKAFLAKLVQVDDVDEYLNRATCEHIIKQIDKPMI